MKALLLSQAGSLANLSIQEIAQPVINKGCLLIKVEAVGLNPVDYKLALSGFKGWHYPFILGLDVAGTIVAIGQEVEGFKLGEAVVFHGNLSKLGGYAEFTLVDARCVTSIPAKLSFIEAAALPCAAMTAYQALTRKINPHYAKTIFIHGGAGGVGGFAVQLARLLGFEVIIASCSKQNKAYVQALGAEHVIDYQTENIKEKIMTLTDGQGVEAVLDTVSKASAVAALDYLAFNGYLVSLLGVIDASHIPDFAKALTISEVTLGGAHLSQNPKAITDLASMLKEVADLAANQHLDLMISEVIPLEKVPNALERLSQRQVRGKIVAKL